MFSSFTAYNGTWHAIVRYIPHTCSLVKNNHYFVGPRPGQSHYTPSRGHPTLGSKWFAFVPADGVAEWFRVSTVIAFWRTVVSVRCPCRSDHVLRPIFRYLQIGLLLFHDSDVWRFHWFVWLAHELSERGMRCNAGGLNYVESLWHRNTNTWAFVCIT